MSVAYTLQYGAHPIDFTVLRRDRRTMQISVLPDASVEIVAPLAANESDILKRINKRAGWICRQIRFFQQYLPRTPERKFISGETHLYLGRRYRLKVIQALEEKTKITRGYIEVRTHCPHQPAAIRQQIEQWLKARARERFRFQLALCLQKFPSPYRITPNGLIIRRLKKRWGSMSDSGRLVLNIGLLQASVREIDYVITHELCHRLHFHHGPKFLELLNRVMPDWAARKNDLERRLS